MVYLSPYDIVLLYALGIIFLFLFLMSKRHGPFEWEEKLAPEHYYTRLGIMLAISVVVIGTTTVFVLIMLFKAL